MGWARAILFALLIVTSPALAKDPHAGAKAESVRLWMAASRGDLEGMKAAVEDGADVDYATDHEWERISVLHVAAMNGNADAVALLLKLGANVNIVDKTGDTPLITASMDRKQNVIKVLIANGADVRRAGTYGHTPLHWAAMNGDPDTAKLLLERGADVNAVNDSRATPLDVASNVSVVDFLLAHGASVSAMSANGETPLSAVDRDLFMAVIAGNIEQLRSVIGRGAHVNVRDGLQSTPLILAVHFGRFDVASLLLDKGADVNEMDMDVFRHNSPLHIAAAQGFPRLVELLLAHHADLEARNARKDTPLAEAANAETATILLRAGASAGAATGRLCGFGTGDVKLAEVLLSYGANANPRTGCSRGSPLLTAITFSHWDVAAVLLDHGADPNATGGSDSTPLTIAAGAGNAATVARLLDHGAEVNAPRKDGDTPLIEAARYGRNDVVKVLLNNGAKVDIKGKDGITVLAAAKNVAAVDLLLSHGASVEDVIPFWFGRDEKLAAPQKALIKAVVTGSVKDAEAAVARHADINYRYQTGSTALQTATTLERAEMVEWLLGRGVDANASDADGNTPLHLAVATGPGDAQPRLRIMQSLLSHGATVDAVNKDGVAPLHIAASLYDNDAVDFLLSKGADPLRRTKDGRTPMQMAQRSEHGTGLFGIPTEGDVRQKAAIVNALRAAVRRQAIPQ